MDPEGTGADAVEEKGIGAIIISRQRQIIVVSAVIALALLGITAWVGGVKTERARLDTFRMDTAALAATMKYPLLEARSLRTDAGRERLQPMVEEIAKAGGYVYVVLTDEKGKVLASTDLNLQGKNVKDVTESSDGSRVERTGDVLRATAPVLVGGSPIGYLRVDADR